MSKFQSKQIMHRDFSSQFKLIRHERDFHFGEHMLMRDNYSKRRVIVKNHQYSNPEELKIIMEDYERLCELYDDNSAQHICKFIGFTLEQSRGTQSINLIYDYHHSTLDEEISAMVLHGEKFTEKDIDLFLSNMIEALSCLQKYCYNHQCLNFKYVLVENRNTIDLKYNLLFTPFLADAIQQIHQNGANIQDYNLSEKQLTNLNAAKSALVPFSQKLRIDKQSLGIFALKMATIDCKDHIYSMDDNYHVIWDAKSLKNRMEEMRSKYSKDLFNKVEYLLFERAFYSFKDMPVFQGSKDSRESRRSIGDSLRRSRNKGHSFERSSPESRLSLGKSAKRPPNSSGAIFDSSKETIFEYPSEFNSESPTKIQAIQYQTALLQIETKIFSQINERDKLKKQCDDGSLYVGSMRGNKKEGYGVCYFKEGDVYGGQWLNDEMEGTGTYLFQNSDRYIGEVSRGLKNGHGKYLYTNGNSYEGKWANDEKEGYGVYHYRTKGQKYEGYWSKGVKEGEGIFTWKSGDKYEGNFKNDLKHGSGVVYKADSTKLYGTWNKDKIVGKVAINYRSGLNYKGEIDQKYSLWGDGTDEVPEGTIYEGSYDHGSRSGNCTIFYSNGDKYKGEILNNKFEGSGLYFYSSTKSEFSGCWKNGLQHGKGILKFSNGSVLECQWQKGKPGDVGTILYSNGDKYEGGISGLGRNGRGTYYKQNGESITGVFKNGVLLSI